jgi:hypothetical protein
MPKSTQTSDWLTFEAAVEIEGHSIDTLTQALKQNSPERAFRVLGFLFDRSRHEASQPCLQLL